MLPLTLAVRTRTVMGRHVPSLRRGGETPAVLYGHQLKPIAVSADSRVLERVWQRAGGSHLVDLTVDGGRPRKVLIREFQVSPRTARPVHVDFFAVNLREKLTAEVPLVLTGDSPAVVGKVGQLLQTLTSLKVECLPGDLPAQISADVSGLADVDDAVLLRDVALPKGVALVHTDLDDVVAKVTQFRVAPAEGADAATEPAVPSADLAAGEAG